MHTRMDNEAYSQFLDGHKPFIVTAIILLEGYHPHCRRYLSLWRVGAIPFGIFYKSLWCLTSDCLIIVMEGWKEISRPLICLSGIYLSEKLKNFTWPFISLPWVPYSVISVRNECRQMCSLVFSQLGISCERGLTDRIYLGNKTFTCMHNYAIVCKWLPV